MLQKAQMHTCGLDDWVEEFNEIYGVVNGKRSIESIWLHAVEHGSELHEDLRIGEFENALGHIADLFCWLCALTTKAHKELGTEESLLEIVLCKYPRICFYCGGKVCFCSEALGRGIEDPKKKAKFTEEALERAKKERARLHTRNNEPKTLQEIVDMFREIYDHINFRTPLEIIMAHLQEEVGEVASCLNDFIDRPEKRFDDQYQRKLEHEIADVVTWIVALTLKFDYLLAAGAIYLVRTNQVPTTAEKAAKLAEYLKTHSLGITLTDIIWTHFQVPGDGTLWCPECKTRPCKRDFLE